MEFGKTYQSETDFPNKIVKLWYDENNIQSHHIESFNSFVTTGLRYILNSTPIHFTTSKGVEIKISIDGVYIPKPYIYDENRKNISMTPYDCISSGSTYSTPVFISVSEEKGGKKRLIDRICLFNLPIMVRSNYCYLSQHYRGSKDCIRDPGGYFIINGIDRVLVTQQRNIYNMIQIHKENSNKYIYKAEIRSMSEDTNHSILIESFISIDGNDVQLQLPFIKTSISFAMLMKAFGIDEDQLLNSLLILFNGKPVDVLMIKRSIQYMYVQYRDKTSVELLEMIGSLGTKKDSYQSFKNDMDESEYLRNYTFQIIDIELFPHLGILSDRQTKLDLLIYMLYRLYATYLGIFQEHDKDNLAHKRFESSGILLYELFKGLYRSAVQDMEVDYEKGSNIIDIFNKIDTNITKNLKYCFSTGKWGIQKNTYIRLGVSQVLNRLSYIATLSHLQRILIPIGKEGKNFKIRQPHPSAFGYICLYETPEGQSCGIVLNMSITTKITIGHNFYIIKTLICRLVSNLMFFKINDKKVPVFLNGVILFYTSYPNQVTDILKKHRINGIVPYDISIAYDKYEDEIRIFCDKGRLIRPFFNNKNYTSWVSTINTFSEALQKGYIIWLDANEVQQLVVGMYLSEEADVWEIHPSLMAGVCAGAIPFSDHTQSPRNVYESSMMKQSIGIFCSNFNHRFDTVFHTLDYPQKSLVSTETARLVGMHDMPAGINCVVAICTYGGWNAEDSVILNRSAIERGLFCSKTYHTYTFEDKIYKSENHKSICIPPPNIRKQELNYYHLDNNGLVRKGAYVKKNDVILGQIQVSIESKDEQKVENIIDCSELSEHEGYIDRVEKFQTHNGNYIIKIIIRQLRIPEIGDKFANMSAQKGTCALILPQEDMPFTSEGIVPDIIMNAHALPSRMTISMLIEMILGKKCAIEGTLGDATPFSKSSLNIAKQLEDALKDYGYDSKGWETMYNGFTGEPFESKIFIGTSYYQRLKHMVIDKIHARSYGNVTSLTRQPLAGRSKDGGLRLGEMERDALLSHGSVQFLRERLFDMSDPFDVLICNDCGVISNYKDECHICMNNELVLTSIPYAAKLVFQMLNGCLLKTQYSTIKN